MVGCIHRWSTWGHGGWFIWQRNAQICREIWNGSKEKKPPIYKELNTFLAYNATSQFLGSEWHKRDENIGPQPRLPGEWWQWHYSRTPKTGRNPNVWQQGKTWTECSYLENATAPRQRNAWREGTSTPPSTRFGCEPKSALQQYLLGNKSKAYRQLSGSEAPNLRIILDVGWLDPVSYTHPTNKFH